LGRSGAPPERQISINDLLVSIEGTRVVIRSARLGREVIPKFTNALNLGRSPHLMKFLGALETQSASPFFAWSWGPLDGASFVPRVAAGRLVLSLARWRLTGKELKE